MFLLDFLYLYECILILLSAVALSHPALPQIYLLYTYLSLCKFFNFLTVFPPVKNTPEHQRQLKFHYA